MNRKTMNAPRAIYAVLAMLLVITLFASERVSAQVGFQMVSTVNIPSPYAMATGDFNGDGALDVCLACPAINSVVVLLGNGVDGFHTPARFLDWQSPLHIATFDINGDGHLDLATANQLNGSIGYCFGDGAGNFSTPNFIFVGGSPMAVTINDFNGDGSGDFAIANSGLGGVVQVLYSDGLGGFLPVEPVAVMPSASYIISGNFDDDANNNIDLAVTSSASSTFGLTYGQGNGSFGPLISHSIGIDDTLWFIAARDINNDGLLDLILPCPNQNFVIIYRSLGWYSYMLPISYQTGEYPRTTRVRDVNMDGNLDLITINQSSGDFSVNLGQGFGGFSDPSSFMSSISSSAMVLGDFNGDGLEDVVAANGISGAIRVHLNITENSPFLRGDVDLDGTLSIGDCISLLDILFGDSPATSCNDASDVDDNGLLGLGDAVNLLTQLFGGAQAPTACELDTTPDALEACSYDSNCP